MDRISVLAGHLTPTDSTAAHPVAAHSTAGVAAADLTAVGAAVDARLKAFAEQLQQPLAGLRTPFRDVYQPLPDMERPASYAGLVDHTLLKPTATAQEIAVLCDEARQYRFAAVCINGSRAAQAVARLAGTPVRVAAVIGFPLGAMTTAAKAFETRELVEAGVREIDMVINVGRLIEGDFAYVIEDIRAVVQAAKGSPGALVKVILECGALNRTQIIDGCIASVLAGAHYVKTSTGFGFGGAKVDDVSLMKQVVGRHCAVKASGGVRTLEDAAAVVRAGADRIGTSAGVAIAQAELAGAQGTASSPVKTTTAPSAAY